MDRSGRTITWWLVVSLVGLALMSNLCGIRQDLPFVPNIDEPQFVTLAVRMASSGDLNPGWFGHPGSTVIYPLAAIYRIWHALVYGRMLFRPDPSLQIAFDSSPAEFYLLGRFLTIAYAALSVPLVYHVGRRAFGGRTGVVGLWFSTLPVVLAAHARMVRTDSAALVFGMLSLWLCLRLYDRPSTGNHILAGLAIGLSVATRYFLVALIPILLAVDGLIAWRQTIQAGRLRFPWLGAMAGLLAAAASFALSAPFFFLDFSTAFQSLGLEARSTHLGADGLSPLGNLWWYLVKAIPLSISWPLAMLAIAGVLLVIWNRRPKQNLLLGFVLMFLAGISLSHLHWQRWIIQILPLLALFAAYALEVAVTHLAIRWRLTSRATRGLWVAAVLAVSVRPVSQLLLFDIQQVNRSTRILAREWMLDHLPEGSRIAQEWYTAPLIGAQFDVQERPSLAEDRVLEDYRRDDYRYLVTSSAI